MADGAKRRELRKQWRLSFNQDRKKEKQREQQGRRKNQGKLGESFRCEAKTERELRVSGKAKKETRGKEGNQEGGKEEFSGKDKITRGRKLRQSEREN